MFRRVVGLLEEVGQHCLSHRYPAIVVCAQAIRRECGESGNDCDVFLLSNLV